MAFGNNVKLVMEDIGVNATELAAAVGVPRPTIYSLLRSDAIPAANLALSICEKLGVDYVLMCENELTAEDIAADPGLFLPPRSEKSAAILRDRYSRRGLPTDGLTFHAVPLSAQLTEEEAALLAGFRALGKTAQHNALSYVSDLSLISKYKAGSKK